MAEGRLARLFGRALDRIDYWITLARLRALDRAYGPLRTHIDRDATTRSRPSRIPRSLCHAQHAAAAPHIRLIVSCKVALTSSKAKPRRFR